jgi:hypothetical protein
VGRITVCPIGARLIAAISQQIAQRERLESETGADLQKELGFPPLAALRRGLEILRQELLRPSLIYPAVGFESPPPAPSNLDLRSLVFPLESAESGPSAGPSVPASGLEFGQKDQL